MVEHAHAKWDANDSFREAHGLPTVFEQFHKNSQHRIDNSTQALSAALNRGCPVYCATLKLTDEEHHSIWTTTKEASRILKLRLESIKKKIRAHGYGIVVSHHQLEPHKNGVAHIHFCFAIHSARGLQTRQKRKTIEEILSLDSQDSAVHVVRLRSPLDIQRMVKYICKMSTRFDNDTYEWKKRKHDCRVLFNQRGLVQGRLAGRGAMSVKKRKDLYKLCMKNTNNRTNYEIFLLATQIMTDELLDYAIGTRGKRLEVAECVRKAKLMYILNKARHILSSRRRMVGAIRHGRRRLTDVIHNIIKKMGDKGVNLLHRSRPVTENHLKHHHDPPNWSIEPSIVETIKSRVTKWTEKMRLQRIQPGTLLVVISTAVRFRPYRFPYR